MNRRNRVKDNGFPANKVIASVAVVAGLLLVLSWVLPWLWQEETAPVPETPPPTSQTQDVTPPAGGQVVQPSEERVALPDPALGDLTLDSEAADGRRVVIPDTVVQQMIAKQSGQPASDTAAPKARVSGAVASLGELNPVIDEIKGPAPQAETDSQTGDTVALLRGKPAEHYTVQLSAGGDRNALQNFARQHGLTGDLWIYQSEYQGRPWFVLIQGEHADLEAARAAIRRLPASLAPSKPWPKRFGQVQQEMRQ